MPPVAIPLEVAAVISAAWWLLSRGWNAAGSLGRARKAPPWQNAFVDSATPFIFGVIFAAFEWRGVSHIATTEPSLWAVYAAPVALYFYAAWRFAAWRWRRRADRGQPVRLHLKPDSPASWVIYIWFGAWLAWQIVHALVPSLLPHWLS